MNKFTRIDRTATEPKARDSRVYGQKVALGEPLQLNTGADLLGQIENSLEVIAKERLLDAENKAKSTAQSILDEAQARAQEILEKANAQAKSLIQTAQEQEASIRDTAQETGFKAGFEEGYADATAQVEQESLSMLDSARLLVEAAYQAEKRVLQEFEPRALQLLQHIAKKVLHQELSDSPETLLNMMSQAVESLYLSGKIRMVVHPEILQAIRQFSTETEKGLEQWQRFEFVPDAALDLQQIYIIGQDGSFELSPNAQLVQLLEPLAEHLELPRTVNSDAVEEIAEPLIENAMEPDLLSDLSPELFEEEESSDER